MDDPLNLSYWNRKVIDWKNSNIIVNYSLMKKMAERRNLRMHNPLACLKIDRHHALFTDNH